MRRPVPLRWILFGLALGLLVPVVVFSCVLVVRLARADRAAAEDRLLHRARTLADAIDAEMGASVRALEALAASEELDRGGNLARFYTEAKRVHATQPLWLSVVLLSPDGKPLEDTSRMLDQPRATALDEASVEHAVSTRGPAIGNLTRHPDGELAFAIRVPVVREQDVRYVLSAIVKPRAVARIAAAGGHAREDWTRSVTDRANTVVARTRGGDAFVGRSATPVFVAETNAADQGMFPSTTLEGMDSLVAFRRTALAGWVTAVVILRDQIDGPVQRATLFVAATGLSLLVVGAGGAFLLGRRLSREIAGARDAAESLAHGKELPPLDSSITEIVRLNRALARSSELIGSHEREREHHLREAEVARVFAEDASRAKDEFLAMLGHELRNPLSPIVAALEVEKLRAGPLRRELSVVERQVRHLVRLVEDLVDISRITRGKITLRREPLELRTVVDRAVEMTKPLYAEHRHALSVDVPAGLVVEADADRLTQVFGNLLTNAAKYTPAGGNVELTARAVDGDVELCVKDDGNGIDEDLLARVFEPFVQGKRSSARQEGGLGIGLTLVRRLVEAHGGTVSATSDGAARGSTFRVSLPRSEAAVVVRSEPAPNVAPSGDAPVRVLVVDDNEDAADLLSELLAAAGHEVRAAHDGFEALDVLEEYPADIAFLDIGLPGMDGHELATRIRERFAERAPVLVALTGYGQPNDRARSERAGFRHHLVKPPDHRALLALVAEAGRVRSSAEADAGA